MKASASAHRARGRPRDQQKRQAILEAASALFMERGIAAATMAAVAEAASASKMTVFAHFPDKPALLTAVFERNTRNISLPDLCESSDVESPLLRLVEFGERLLAFLTRPEIVRTGRMMAANADQFPTLAAAFYAAGPGAIIARASIFLKSLADRRLIALDDTEMAAEQLVSACLGVSRLRQSLGLAPPPSREQIARNVRFATQTLFRAWSVDASAFGPQGPDSR